MSNVVFQSLLMAAKWLISMIGYPGTKRRLRFGEMFINGWIEEMFVTWKNPIAKFIQVNNSVNGLTRQLTLVLIRVSILSLVITKYPNGLNRINHRMESRGNTKLVNHDGLEVITEEIILKPSPVNQTEPFQQVWPS